VSPRIYATIGRAAGNDVVLDDPTVSNHHARLSWAGTSLVVEDLSSANGTFVDGQRVKSARTRPGAELRLGQVILPWSHPGLRTLLKSGVGARTLVVPKGMKPTYVCGACGHAGELPPGPPPKELTCESCGETLRTDRKPRGARRGSSSSALWLLPALAVMLVLGAYAWTRSPNAPELPTVPTTLAEVQETIEGARAEQRIGGETAERIAKAFTPMDPLTRNTAVKIAARTEGPFHVEQVAEIWNAVRQPWKYVNDPEGRDYFATPSETIQNGYVGDCDDFAIALASMVSAIGGKARVVIMDGPRGGHAYAEACVQGDPSKVASALIKHYRNRWKRYVTGKIPSTIAYRTSEECPIWLNLDWNSSVPGGAYEPESWAVAVYQDGKNETLAPAAAPASAASKTTTAATR
jgi:predicted transglutaminase-like cysteine proteinase